MMMMTMTIKRNITRLLILFFNYVRTIKKVTITAESASLIDEANKQGLSTLRDDLEVEA